MFRQFRFILCCAGALMLYKLSGAGPVFYGAALNAFANLFSGQIDCASGACDTESQRPSLDDPVYKLHLLTTAIGALTALYGVVQIWF